MAPSSLKKNQVFSTFRTFSIILSFFNFSGLIIFNSYFYQRLFSAQISPLLISRDDCRHQCIHSFSPVTHSLTEPRQSKKSQVATHTHNRVMFEQQKTHCCCCCKSYRSFTRALKVFIHKKQQHKSQPQRVVFINEIKAMSAWDAPLKNTSR